MEQVVEHVMEQVPRLKDTGQKTNAHNQSHTHSHQSQICIVFAKETACVGLCIRGASANAGPMHVYET